MLRSSTKYTWYTSCLTSYGSCFLLNSPHNPCSSTDCYIQVRIEELEDNEKGLNIKVGINPMEVVGDSGLALPFPPSGSFSKEEETSSLEDLFGAMDVTFHLLDMGFTEEEICFAIDTFGPEVPVCGLADSIFARRIALNCVNKEKDPSDEKNSDGLQNQNEPRHLDPAAEEHLKNCFSVGEMGETAMPTSNDIIDECREIQKGIMSKKNAVQDKMEECLKCSFSAAGIGKGRTSHLNVVGCHYEEMQKGKKAKHMHAYNKTGSYENKSKEAKVITSMEMHSGFHVSYKEIGDSTSALHKLKKPEHIPVQTICPVLSKPPFFFYGNVLDVSQDAWKRLSQFLYGVETEYVNTQLFSAFMRKEGYLHNLPRDNRFHILPRPPMTIEDALPHTKKWWPSWDTRKQLSGITLDTAGVAHICDHLEWMLKDCHGILSKEQQVDVLHQCKTLNLIWVGQHRLSPVEPDQIERLLGYPVQHTQVHGLLPNDRLGVLKCCFQIDTLGYHLSVLKKIYPSGLRVLSVFSGIGGAEIALHRLGIHLKCDVSMEVSQVNRTILKKWWQNTGQSGELRQIDDIEGLTCKKIENLIEEFGGFDLVIGTNPCTCVSGGPSRCKPLAIGMNPFHEFDRVFKTVRSIMGQNK